MSEFLRKIRKAVEKRMQGRNGVDQLGWAALIIAAFLYFIGFITQEGILLFAGTLLYGYCIFRMLSKNRGQRNLENRRFLNMKRMLKKRVSQFFLRLKNSRRYKYFHCPKCHVPMRLSRGCGEKKIHCPKCHHEFSRKA